jgi:hypothetical protein
MTKYKRFPPDPPTMRTIFWIVIAVALVVLTARIA